MWPEIKYSGFISETGEVTIKGETSVLFPMKTHATLYRATVDRTRFPLPVTEITRILEEMIEHDKKSIEPTAARGVRGVEYVPPMKDREGRSDTLRTDKAEG